MRSLKALVIDDDEIVCTLLGDFLTKQGHQATTHTSPRLGMSAARNQVFDVVFLDIRMPELDGLQVLREMRPLLPKAAFVMITASADDERVGEALSAGAGFCLSKPFDSAMVAEILAVLLGG
jgi:CheY-like chemotaxis protein